MALSNSISESMQGHVVRCTNSYQIWTTLEQLAAGNSRARLLQLRFQLQSVKKGSLSINDYILKMKSIVDSINDAGQAISDEDLTLYILGGLGSEYDLVVINLTSRQDSISLSEVQFLLQFKMRVEALSASSTLDLGRTVNLAVQNKIYNKNGSP